MKAALLYIMMAVGGMLIRPDAVAQGVRIGADGAGAPDASALLDLDVTSMAEKKGILFPRMTEAERDEISSPSESLFIYQTDGTAGFKYFDGADWVGFGGGGTDDLGDHTATENIGLNGNWLSGDGDSEGITIANNGNIGLGVAAAQANLHAAGPFMVDDLAGSGNRMVVADANGQLSTQPIPAAPGTGTTLNIHLTNNVSNIDVAGVSFIYFTTDDDHEIRGFQGGVQNQIIYLANPEDEDDIKFKKNNGMQKFIKDLDLKKEEGAIVMYTGSNWITISQH